MTSRSWSRRRLPAPWRPCVRRRVVVLHRRRGRTGCERLELSGGFVGFTLVALGTSAPELVTSVQAARQGETELLVGNLLGSNVFNSLAVGGIIGLVGPGPVLDTTLAETGSS